MRRSLCLLLALVCLASLPCALGEEAAEGTLQTSAALSDMEQVIDPVYPVPDYVEWLLDVARGELGYKEQSGGVTKYGAWAGDPAAEWCAEFLCWCVDQVDKQMATHLLTQQYPYYTGNNTGRDWFLKKGRYVARSGTVPGWGAQWYPGDTALMEKNSYVPQPGDWVFFSTNSTGDTCHVAMVEYCAYNENDRIMVHVIEGNNPSAVARNAYKLTDWSILGYGTVHDAAQITLRTGNEGEKVTALQQKLVSAGLLGTQSTTGKYGALTTQAVKNFQTQMGIEPSGVANYQTQTALDDYLAALPAANE